MSNRWKMNRMGFVNFWLYDEETFDLCDGKILLRGQNGAGKSIATQSFIPFILDGDKTPRRLDPFGTKDRRMEYYFLGEGQAEKEESTGYLFLEFVKPETGQYRTIGIGQRAQRGKPMSFWGFILLDGRRIGYDLELYKQVGSSKIPYAKQDLKKVLGEQALFTDMQGEYKALVNKYLFGFPRMDQYEQFIQLLIKVRAPKLSNVFKPKTVYEILNDSLQTLTDEELRAMVDAMEKMDHIQGNLEDLQAAQKETQVIRTEYTRYNQFMLGRKAKAYLREKHYAEESQARAEADRERLEGFEAELRNKEEERQEAEGQRRILETELEELQDADLDLAAGRLEKARDEKKNAEEEKTQIEGEISRRRDYITQSAYALKEIENGLYSCRKELTEQRSQMEDLQETAQFSRHVAVMEAIRNEDAQAGDGQNGEEVRLSFKNQIQNVTDGIQTLKEFDEWGHRYDLAEEELDRCRSAEAKAASEFEAAEVRTEDCRDDLIEAYYRKAKGFKELELEDKDLKKLEQVVSGYQNAGDEAEAKALLERRRDGLRKSLSAAETDAKYREEKVRAELSEKGRELEALRANKEIEPPRKEKTEQARKLLQQAGIEFVPFFKAVEFSPSLSEESCALLESQLMDAGILDALVLSEDSKMQIGTKFDEFSDVFVQVAGDGGSGFHDLVVSEDLPSSLKKATRKVLSHIYRTAGKEGSLYLGEQGSFRHGILSGVSLGEGKASYVGTLARKKKREQMIADLEDEIVALKEMLGNILNERSGISTRMETLDHEYESLPDFHPLQSALETLRQVKWNLSQAEDLRKKAEAEAERIQHEKANCYQRVLKICKGLPYERRTDALQEAKQALEEYRDLWVEVRHILTRLSGLLLRRNGEQEKIEREEEEIDGAQLRLTKAMRTIREADTRIREIEDYLNRPENKERAQRLLQVRTAISDILSKLQQNGERCAVLKNEIDHLLSEKEETLRKVTEAIARETAVRKYFEEELSLKLVILRENRTTEECAKAALEKLRESDQNREAGDITASLLRVFQQRNGNLTAFGTALEDCFDSVDENLTSERGMEDVLRKRLLFTAAWNGRKLSMEDFYQTLKERIEETELLIQQKDRELFEDILSKTLSQQLTDRIAESRRWVSSMSKLMRSMDTSMGLSFSLDWKPKSAENGEQLDTDELEKLLLRDKKLLTPEDMEKVASHFRNKIHLEKQRAEEAGEAVNYMDMVREALDYRKWFEFQIAYYRNQDGKKILTDSAFNRFSGGEKAMAMYVPLLAALNAQYQKAKKEDHPRIVAMDEAFAGVDDKNISMMFALVEQLDFDYIMNSQSLWGCYETVPALHISELHRPANSQIVSIINYTWNGHERVLAQ